MTTGARIKIFLSVQVRSGTVITERIGKPVEIISLPFQHIYNKGELGCRSTFVYSVESKSVDEKGGLLYETKAPCRNFTAFHLKMTISVISVSDLQCKFIGISVFYKFVQTLLVYLTN